ncbi:MAG: hypothetical protein KAI07_00910 [Deltaproteobacteria bacterium]|nr:hypothetical protein [Deltaproteobacteria bacterium]
MSHSLTPQEDIFVTRVANQPGTPALDHVRAVWPELKNHKAKYSALMKKDKIATAIKQRTEINLYRVTYSTQDIVDALWLEARREGRGTSQNGRIQALVWLGKHVGMFTPEKEEKEDDSGVTYNIINYKTHVDTRLEKRVEKEVRKIERVPKNPDIPGVVVTNYNKL